MNYHLRLLCYSGPDRQTSTQIPPDIVQSILAQFAYGQPVQIGPDEADPATWGRYRVANVTQMKQLEDPTHEGKKALLCEVHFARVDELFKVQDELIRAVRVGEL